MTITEVIWYCTGFARRVLKSLGSALTWIGKAKLLRPADREDRRGAYRPTYARGVRHHTRADDSMIAYCLTGAAKYLLILNSERTRNSEPGSEFLLGVPKTLIRAEVPDRTPIWEPP